MVGYSVLFRNKEPTQMTKKAASRLADIATELQSLSVEKSNLLVREDATYEELDEINAKIEQLSQEARDLQVSGGHKRRALESELAELVAANRD